MAQPDPRTRITEEGFSIAPQLLGLPLARPSRRLVAILLDLLIVAILVQLGGGFLLALAAGVTFFRLAARGTWGSGRFFGRAVKLAFRATGALMLFVVSLNLLGRLGGDDEDDDDEPRPEPAPAVAAAEGTGDADAPPVSTGGVLRMTTGFVAFQRAESEEEAREAAGRVVEEMRKTGVSDAEIRAALESTAGGREMQLAVLDRLLPPDSSAGRAPRDPDSLAVAYAAAVAAGDSAARDSLRPRVGEALAAPRLGALSGEVAELREDRDELRRALERERERGFLPDLLEWLDDLGLGFGWTGLYFTAFTALWKGQTPAKRLLGIRVVRLNGLPMTLWASFERFGGYAAGLFTGLLGFAQVYWDRNRQAIHDKITETVVIRESAGASARKSEISRA